MNLLKDENADVRLNVASGIVKLAPIVGPDILTPTFLTTLTNMTKDT